MIDVTCAIIRNDDEEILVVQRGELSDHPFKWEFPGGKIDAGETAEDCIVREIREELSIDIIICRALDYVEHDYGRKQIRLHPFICDTLDLLPVLSEHIDFKWVPVEKLSDIDFSEADIMVASDYLEQTAADQKCLTGAVISEDDSENEAAEELKETINRMMSMEEADFIAVSAIENQAILRKLLTYSESPDKKLAFRASWTLTKVHDRARDLMDPHLAWVTAIAVSTTNESVERSMLRILSMSDVSMLDRKQQGLITDHCFRALSSADSAIAIKAYAMEILYRYALIYPELGNELSVSIRSLMEEGSAGIVSRGRFILKKISEIPLG